MMKWVRLWVPEGKYTMTLEQQGFWDRILQMAGRHANFNKAGTVGVTDEAGYSHKQLSSLIGVTEEVTKTMILWLVQEKMVEIDNNDVIHIVNWKHYQGEWLRKSEWRKKRDKMTGQNDGTIVLQNVPSKNKELRINNKDNTLVSPKPLTIVNEWFNRYQSKMGSPYAVQAKDASILNRLDKTLGREEILRRMDRFFESQDKFIKEAGYTTGVFSSMINKLVEAPKHFRGAY